MPRNRQVYIALVLIVITVGVFSRSSFMPEGFLKEYAGDVLWSFMVYLGLCFLFPKWSAIKVAIYALSFSYAIEISQLNQQDWLKDLRATRLGSLILGHGFLWSDFLCYTVGVLLGYLLDRKISNNRKG